MLIRQLPLREKRRGVLAVIYTLLSILLEFVSLASLVPLMFLLFQYDSIHTFGYFQWLFTCLGFLNEIGLILLLCLLVVLLLIVKSIISHVLNVSQTKFFLRLYKYFSLRLFTFYYSKGLLFFKNSNTSRLVYSVNYVAHAVIFNIISPIIKVGAEAVLLLLLLGVVMVLNVKVFMLFVAVLSLFVFIGSRYVRGVLEEIGKVENESRKEQTKIVHEAFKGYAEVEVNNVFPMLLKNYEAELNVQCACKDKGDKVRSLGNRMIEVGVFTGIIGFLLCNYFLKGKGVAITFTAVLFMRLFYSMRGIFTNLIQIKSNLSIWKVFEEMLNSSCNTMVASDISPLCFYHQVCIRNISFGFTNDKDVFSTLSLSVRKGEKVGIKGLSGSGKSTLFHLLLGLYTPSRGKILIDDVELTSKNSKGWHKMVGYVSQNVFILDGTIAANVAIGVDEKDIDWNRLYLALEQANLSDFLKKFPKGVKSKLGDGGCKVSGGERQRIGVARALYRNACFFLFDEATSSVDIHSEQEIIRSIKLLSKKRPDLTMMVIAHRKESLEFCDRVVEL